MSESLAAVHELSRLAAETPSALPYCPCCEGSGMVPTASGMSDQPCLCATLSGMDRTILQGRMEYATRLASSAERMTGLPRRAYLQWAAETRESAAHIVAGCVGPCRGNSCAPGAARCVA